MSKYISKENLNHIVQEMGKKVNIIDDLTNEELQEIIDEFNPEFVPEDEDNADRGLSNLTSTGEDHFLGSNNFVYIYPNGGSASSPAYVANNSRYVETNPFPGYAVHCQAEIFHANKWGATGHYGYRDSDTHAGVFVEANQLDNGDIVVQTGSSFLTMNSNASGNPFGLYGAFDTARCRIKVWKIGKLVNNA